MTLGVRPVGVQAWQLWRSEQRFGQELPMELGYLSAVVGLRQHLALKVQGSPAMAFQEESDFQSPVWRWMALLRVAADSPVTPRILQRVWKGALERVWSLGSGGERVLERWNSVLRWQFPVRQAV